MKFRSLMYALTLICLGLPAGAARNLLANPEFDTTTAGWFFSIPPTNGFASWDSNGYPASGSFFMLNTTPAAAHALLTVQCVPVTPGQLYSLHGLYRMVSNQGVVGSAFIAASFYALPSCAGTEVGPTLGATLGSTSDNWLAFPRSTALAPATALSAQIAIVLTKDDAGGALGASFDHMYFGPLVKGDLDGDGQTDLLFKQLDSPGHHEAWLMDGTTRISSVALTPELASNFQVVGIDKFIALPGGNPDDIDDVVLWNTTSGAVVFAAMDATGVHVAGAGTLTGANPLPLNWRVAATADFDHDGKPDLLWRNLTSQKLVVWKIVAGAKVGALVPSPDQAVDANWSVVAALDWNADGNADLLWYNASSGKIVLWFMDQNVVRTTGQFTNPANAGDNNWQVVAAGDYGVGPGGQSGTNDIVWRNATSGNLVVWYMDQAGNRTAGVFTSPAAPTNALNWNVVGPK